MDYKYFLLTKDEKNVEDLQLIRIDTIELVQFAQGRIFQSTITSAPPIVVLYRDPDGVYEAESRQTLVLSDEELDVLPWENRKWPAIQE